MRIASLQCLTNIARDSFVSALRIESLAETLLKGKQLPAGPMNVVGFGS